MKIQQIKFLIIFLFFSTTVTVNASVPQSSVSFQVFYDGLAPYGQWVENPTYGYVWIPNADADFMPYSSGGHWVWTDYGWTWVSDYEWGWAPFHYGRWDYMDYYGWVWIPGDEWGPAWVAWRGSQDYYGWAPLGPGITVDLAIGGNFYLPPDHWCFVNSQYMGRNDIHQHYGPRNSNQKFIDNSTIINNTSADKNRRTTYISGPRKEDVQKATGTEIKKISVRENPKPGQSFKNNELAIYRPIVSKNTETNKARPTKISDKNDIKPLSERKQPNSAADTKSNSNTKAAPQRNNIVKNNSTKKETVNRKANPDMQSYTGRKTTEQPQKQPIQPSQQKQEQSTLPIQKSNPNPTSVNRQPAQPVKQPPVQKQNIEPNKENNRQPVQPPLPKERPVEPPHENVTPSREPMPTPHQQPPPQRGTRE
jgi:hypothetical protein